MNDMIGREETK